LSEEERKNYPFEYRYSSMYDNGLYASSFLHPSIGFGFMWSHCEIELQYQRKHAYFANIVYIDKNIKSYSISFSYNFQLFKHQGASNEKE